MKAHWRMLRSPVHLLSLGFGSGLSKHLPGTAGTLAAIPFYLLLTKFTPEIYAAIVALASLIGIWVCHQTSKALGGKDHRAIVWDEFVGFWIAMLFMPPDWEWIVMGFLLFRFFDMFKPWPISLADKHLHGGFGIMFDDVLAGGFTCAVLHTLNLLISL